MDQKKSDVTELSQVVGAEESDGANLTATARDQIGHGADVIKYTIAGGTEYRQSMPTFTVEEIKNMAQVATNHGRPVVAHAGTKYACRAIEGVETEHGNDGDEEPLLMKTGRMPAQHTVGDATAQYAGWKKGTDEPIHKQKKEFAMALKSGVTIAFGGDAGVDAHGDNVREMEMMADHGMKPTGRLQLSCL
jgi:imidazolonepropionase-like amidohydrolase